MLQNYLTTAWRNLRKNKVYSFINVLGLAMGMAVTLLISLWVTDEVTFDRHHENFPRIAQVLQHQYFNGEIGTQEANPYVLSEEIRQTYGHLFTYVLQSSWIFEHVLRYEDKMLFQRGSYFEPGVADMLSLHMVEGSRDGLSDMNSIMLSKSVARTYFGEEPALGKVLRLNNKADVKVTGVYEDIPSNSSFAELKCILPWSLYLNQNPWMAKMKDPWNSNFTRTFAMIAEGEEMQSVSDKIRDAKLNRVGEEEKKYNPIIFLHPMNKWRLYSDFKNGVNTGGRIGTVSLLGVIGFFVLVLACINFMNLSTAKSEKRAREVGIRKSVGSLRWQLIGQFYSESLMYALLSLIAALLLAGISLPFFNDVAGKHLTIPLDEPIFWIAAILLVLLTGLLAGSYPAIFLSSFRPVAVLKGTYRMGRSASWPRQVLVVLQFLISSTIVIGTAAVYRQIQHAQNRPLGYSRDGLVWTTAYEEIHKHFEAVRNELIQSGAIVEMCESGSPTTSIWNTNSGFDWQGKDPQQAVDFPNNAVSYGYGKTIGWSVVAGRDFSEEVKSDTAAFILNEAAVKFIGFSNPIGQVIRWNGKPFTVIGVVRDVVATSPYIPVQPMMWHATNELENVFMLRLNPKRPVQDALQEVQKVFTREYPAAPHDPVFVDQEHARKFGNEQRLGKLAAAFAFLAIIISCLGLFGLASFVAEQRTREIGIRKVLGASVGGLWRMISHDFVLLVLIAAALAIPLSWWLADNWLQKFEYRTTLPWWIFATTTAGALIVSLLTVSYHALRASTMNPVRSLRTE